MNHSGRVKRTRSRRPRKERRTKRTRVRITRRGRGLKRGRSPQNQGRTSPPKYQGVPIPMGIPVQQVPQEQMPPMGIPLGRGVSRRRHLKKRRRSRQMRGGGIKELMGFHSLGELNFTIEDETYPTTLYILDVKELTNKSGYTITSKLVFHDKEVDTSQDKEDDKSYTLIINYRTGSGFRPSTIAFEVRDSRNVLIPTGEISDLTKDAITTLINQKLAINSELEKEHWFRKNTKTMKLKT